MVCSRVTIQVASFYIKFVSEGRRGPGLWPVCYAAFILVPCHLSARPYSRVFLYSL